MSPCSVVGDHQYINIHLISISIHPCHLQPIVQELWKAYHHAHNALVPWVVCTILHGFVTRVPVSMWRWPGIRPRRLGDGRFYDEHVMLNLIATINAASRLSSSTLLFFNWKYKGKFLIEQEPAYSETCWQHFQSKLVDQTSPTNDLLFKEENQRMWLALVDVSQWDAKHSQVRLHFRAISHRWV